MFLRRLIVVLVAACAVGACEPTAPVDRDAGIITATPAHLSLRVGEEFPLAATGNHTSMPAVVWRSSSTTVATVNEVGVVTGVAPGAATVTVISVQDTTRRADVAVTVSPGGGAVARPMQLEPDHALLEIGARAAFLAVFDGAYTGGVTWRSSAPSIATVSPAGEVRGIETGDAIITAVANSDTTVRSTALIRVAMRVLGRGAVNERFTAEVAVRGDWAYTSTWGVRALGASVNRGNTIYVWNVAGNAPVRMDSLPIPGAATTGDVQISDDGALLVVAIEYGPNGAIMIYDRSNPLRPDSLARFASPNTSQGVHTVKLGRVNGRHYAFLSVTEGLRLTIVDITDPRAPFEVFSQQLGDAGPQDVFVRDGMLFTALWHNGMRIYDIGGGGRGGSPSNPVLVGAIPTVSGFIHNLWWFHDPTNGSKRYVFLGEENAGNLPSSQSSGDIHVIDITNPALPVQVAQYGVPGAGTHNFSMDEASGILYAAYNNAGVRAIDVRGDLSACAAHERNVRGFCDLRIMGRERGVGLTATFPTSTGMVTPYVWGVAHQGTHLYASDMRLGLFKLDASTLKR